MDHSRSNVERMELDSLKCRTHSHLRRGPIELVVSGGSGRRFLGNGKDLIKESRHKVDISEHIDHRFNLEKFVESVLWLNDNIGVDNWCYDGMTYHFRDLGHLINFKLRYLYD